jgi:hypothetical protein
MQRNTLKRANSILIAAALGGIVWVSAGDLNPPPGAVTPTMKTLAEVEPRIVVNATNTPGGEDSVFRIAASGSYYLTSNISGESGKHGIKIATDNVTLDLNGFTMTGHYESLDGIQAGHELSPRINIVVRNGIVKDWPGSGVNLANTLYCVLQDLLAWQNGDDGFNLGGGGRIENCTAALNSGDGIEASNSLIRGNTAVSNAQNIKATDGSAVIDNHAP